MDVSKYVGNYTDDIAEGFGKPSAFGKDVPFDLTPGRVAPPISDAADNFVSKADDDWLTDALVNGKNLESSRYFIRSAPHEAHVEAYVDDYLRNKSTASNILENAATMPSTSDAVTDVLTDNFGTAERLHNNAYEMGMPMSDKTFSKFQDIASKYELGVPFDIDDVRGIDLFPNTQPFPRTYHSDVYAPTLDGVHKGNTKLMDFYDKLYIEDSVARGLPFNRNSHYGWTGAHMEPEMWHSYSRFGTPGNSPSFKSLFKYLDDEQIEQLLREYHRNDSWY
jgi:hypothetical protein